MSKNSESVKQQTIEVESFMLVNIKDLYCPIIAVYIHPEDYPDKIVARVFEMEKPTNTIVIRDTIEELREDIQQAYPWMIRFNRAKNDVLSIAETWL